MNRLTPWLSLVGRILVAAIFLLPSIHAVANPIITKRYMEAMDMNWWTGFLYIGGILFEAGGALTILFGYLTRIGAWLLITFMIPTTFVTLINANFGDPNHVVHLFKNLSLLGGLFYIAAYGAGPVSIDARLDSGLEASASLRLN